MTAGEVEIPTYQDLFVPTLRALERLGGSAGNDELDRTVIEIGGITDEHLSVEFSEGQTQTGSKVLHRIPWARTYLKKVGLVENPQRSTWVLLEAGRAMLDLDPEDAQARIVEIERQVRSEDRDRAAGETSRIRRAADPDYAAPYAIAQEWRDRSLTSGWSLLAPDQQVWTAEAALDLQHRFIDSADEGNRSFQEKLEDQMRGADMTSLLLMAELMLVHLLPLNNVTQKTKTNHLNTIGSWASTPFETPARFEAALSTGIFSGGAGFNTGRPAHLRFLVRMVQRWVALTDGRRAELLQDPWGFKDFLHDIPLEGAMSQRNAVLLMLFPNHFEDISAREHKRRIAAAFPAEAGDSTDIDRQILAIRAAKTDEFGQDFSWYNQVIRELWDKKAPKRSRTVALSSPSEALNTWLTGDDAHKFAEMMARAILAAHEVNPASWVVTFRSSGMFLNVGRNSTLSVRRDGAVGIALSGDDVDEISGYFETEGVAAKDIGQFSSPTGVFHASSDDEQRVGEFLSLCEERFMQAVVATAVSKTSFWKSHSPVALDAIRDLSGVELPDMPERDSSTRNDQRAWLVRMKYDDGTSAIADALERGDSRIFWEIDVPADSSLEVIKAAFRRQDPEIANHLLGSQAGNVHRFITRMQPGDVVLMPERSDLYLGTVTGDAEFLDEDRDWTRPVDWLDDPVDRGDVSPALYSKLRSLLTVTDLTEVLPELLGYLGGDEEDSIDGPTKPSVAVSMPTIDDDLAKDWMLDRDWLEEISSLLSRKRQLIFYGPPGTGKTYLAEKLAGHLTSDGGSYKLVQFHPSYSYEDFVEGFRPRVDAAGNLTYELTPGPIRLLAEAARANPAEPYFLIIDEINRGNLAKIFGELYYLLEYRDQSLVLQYGSSEDDEFSLPENLFVIGTMNTADRSIAMVDAAIRRRFNFVEFSPTQAPIADLLPTWLRHNMQSSEPAQLLAELNRRLDDADYAIGPSYLMNDDVKDQAGLERIWKYSIMPLLTEHFYGQRGATDRFGLAELQRAVRGSELPVDAEPVVDEVASSDDDND